MSTDESSQLLAEDPSNEDNEESFSESAKLINRDKSTQWDYDVAVRRVGFGRYQFLLWFFLFLVSMSCGFNNMAMVFEGGSSGQVCATPPNTTSHHNTTITTYVPGECSYNKTVTTNSSSYTEKVDCDEWIYDTDVFSSTIITEWDLTCGKEYLVDLSATIYMLGFFSGCLVLGDLADRFGRRLLLLLSAALTLAAGVGAAFSPSYAVFATLRFFVGVGVAGTRNSAYILAAEYARPEDRATLGLLSDATYSISYICTGFIFYLDPNWRHFQFYIGVYHIFYLTYIFFIPESPRWLLLQGKDKQVLQYFRTSAKINKKRMPDNITVVLDQQPHKSHSTIDLIRTPNLRRVGIVAVFLWFIVSLVYFGMTYNVENLKGSIYVNNAILGGVELIANGASIWVIKWGRRSSIFSMFMLAFASMFAIIFAQANYWATIVLAMIGKFIISPCFSYIYIATVELYPTQTRTLALGAGSGMARLGGALAPFIPSTYEYWDKLPYIIFSSACIIGALDALFLPETKDRPLPDSIESAEKMNIVRLNPPYDCRRSSPTDEDDSGVAA